MKKTISRKVYDTDKATSLGFRYVGEFGHANGFEEQLFLTKAGQHFIYGIGGSESPYNEPIIKLITDKQADEWKKANKIK